LNERYTSSAEKPIYSGVITEISTDVYRLKKKLFKEWYGIELSELFKE
jgi:hypothetical protein